MDKVRTKAIAIFLWIAVTNLEHASALAREIADTKSTIAGEGLADLLRPTINKISDWAKDIDNWYGES